MDINFATCERNRALEFLKKVYPNYDVKDEGTAKDLLDLVEKDIVRIQDPMMYGNRIQVTAGTNWKENEEDRTKIMEVCQKFHDNPGKPINEGG